LRGPGKGEQDLFHSRYDADWEKFAVELHQQFTSWGFNTVDHGVELLKRYWPYFASRGLVRTSKYYGKPGSSNAWEFPDVFDPAVASRMAAEVEAFCREHRESKNLIAYLWTDTPTWDLHKTRRFRQTDWVSEIRKLPAASPGWREYGAFLERTYRGDIEQFNRAYGLSARDFAQLQEVSLTSLDVDRYEVERDDQRFLGEIARRYYEIVGTAMRRHDPNHLIFGEKYLMGDIPPQVLEAALPYIDALAVQPGDGYLPIYTPGDLYPAKEMAELHTISGKPIFICDHQISFPTRIHPHVIWPYHQRKTEEEAAAATGNFVRAAFADPFVIGYMRCQYIDRFAAFRGALKQGLVRHDGSLYDQLVAETSRANADAIRIVRRAAGME
ncbi:MAG: hypothetical protein KAX37_11535, partial [Opitutaceae bacterium]|nr:hypothetical protein [Opitutaceae bacterium]